MKAFRYSLLLPLIHLAISVPVIYHEEASIWRQIPRIQVGEDFEKIAPPPVIHAGPMIEWRPCYEYRASTADRFIFAVEFPAGMLIPPHGASGCNPTLLRPILQKLKNWIRVQPRIALLDSLLLLGIAGQWWLVCRWIDRLREWSKHTKRWIIPAVTINLWDPSGRSFPRKQLAMGVCRHRPALNGAPFLAGAALVVRHHVGAMGHTLQQKRLCDESN